VPNEETQSGPVVGGGRLPLAPNNPASANSTDPKVPGVTGTCETIAVVTSPSNGVGVYGSGAVGVQGVGDTGVLGVSQSQGGTGVRGQSSDFDAVVGETTSTAHAGVTGRNLTTGANGGVGIYGVGGQYAGKFDGDVLLNGTLTVKTDIVLQGSDCAEHFEVVESADVVPGTVMVLDSAGILEPSTRRYDLKVVGIVSGAGDYRPGLILGAITSSRKRVPIALSGKTFCKVDARYSAIAVGDLLTTSPTPGHAMKATDRELAFGAVIGKALCPLQDGQGLIAVLVTLQ
jgi:hypothetical protein